MDIKTLIAVATGKIPHNYRSGLCPDELQPDSRDPDCPACKILTEAAAEHDEMERRLREAEARVTALRYIAWEAAGYMDCVHAAKRAIGETGALPPPPKIQPTRGEG